MTITAAQLAEAKSRMENLSPAQVAREAEQGTVPVDLCKPVELDTDGMIAGAVRAPRGMLEFWADPSTPYHRPEFRPDRRMILYCASGGRSAPAQVLTQLGYTDVRPPRRRYQGLEAGRLPGRRTGQRVITGCPSALLTVTSRAGATSYAYEHELV